MEKKKQSNRRERGREKAAELGSSRREKGIREKLLSKRGGF